MPPTLTGDVGAVTLPIHCEAAAGLYRERGDMTPPIHVAGDPFAKPTLAGCRRVRTRAHEWISHTWPTLFVAAGLTVEQWDDKFFTEYLTENRFAGEMGTNESSIIQVKENLMKSLAIASTLRSSTS